MVPVVRAFRPGFLCRPAPEAEREARVGATVTSAGTSTASAAVKDAEGATGTVDNMGR